MHCDYCDIRYDIIGRVETLEDDLEYIAEVNDFKSDLYRIKDDLHVHPTFKRKIGITEETEKIKRYLMQVLKYITFVTCITMLKEIWKLDI